VLSQWQTLRFVVIPQAVRRIIPPLLNDFVALQKDTALVTIVGMLDVLNEAQLLKNRYFNLSPVTSAALFILIVTIPMTRLVDYLIDRDRRRISAQ
jgi:polar amino acid transport system permease protein